MIARSGTDNTARGKTSESRSATLLRALQGLAAPTAGRAMLFGVDGLALGEAELARRIGKRFERRALDCYADEFEILARAGIENTTLDHARAGGWPGDGRRVGGSRRFDGQLER